VTEADVVRVLFLGGLGRSGTTLLERILGELPGVHALGELVHLWQRDVLDDERCGCGERFSDCDFWQRVGAEAYGGWRPELARRVLALRSTVERTRYVPALAAPRLRAARGRLVREYAEVYRRIYAAAARVSGADVVVDSSKHAALAFCLRWCPDLDLRVVHVVRDSRGVAYSWTKHRGRPEADGSEMTRYPPARSALLWNAHNAAFGLLERLGVPVLRIRYEEFVADPVAGTQALCDFAGVAPPDGALRFLGPSSAFLSTGHSAAGNPMRFTTGRIELRRDDAWRSALPATQRHLVSALTAPLLGAYGYRVRVPR
jgi:hypothetical protein